MEYKFAIVIFIQAIVLVLGHENSTINVVRSNSSELQSPEQLEECANVMFAEYWQIVLQDDPEYATVLGDHRYDDRLTSYSLKCYEKKKVMMNEFIERANQMLSIATEGSETHSNLLLFITHLQFKVDNLMSGSYLFPVSKLSTPQISLLSLLKYTKINNSEQAWNLIARYKAVTKKVDEQIELMREGIRTNFTLSEVSMLSKSGDWNESVENSVFYEPFLNISQWVAAEEVNAIQENATDAILNYVIPAFVKLDDFVNNEYRLHARPGIGVSSLPNGRDFYQQELTYHLTDTSVTAEQIHQMGLLEVERITKEMDEVIKSLNLNMTQQEFSNMIRNDEAQFFKTEEEALETYREVLEKDITPKLKLLFKNIPEKKLTVEKMPKEMATGPQAYYMMPSADNSTPGTFYLDTSSLHNTPKYDVVTLAMHEGVPGHHFQYAYVMEQNDIPDFRKYGVHSTAFIEGWALYAEYLGYELELYDNPYMRYGHLSYEIFRACRMVVDTGMHVMGWSRQQAIDYMMNNSASTLNNIEREVDRYITWPGQACGYKYGELKIKAMRKKAVEAMGEAFDVKEFHDIVLRNNGPLELFKDACSK
ncbi:uncharacterized protein NPIL_524991 [Nephila pilipes]|uniref:DUF885 domain-containing protein n=1 Tax=Nephila pilipes TaxID=299642 RepID=A0A8X6NQG0_NEPPI|nr:uncharacterized protein NPIL_524991 [Nephila pilipes]